MPFPRRALLYLARKRGKTLTLLALLFVVAALALTSWSIRGAAQTAQLNVRQALGGTFTVEPDSSNMSNWGSSSVGSGSQITFQGDPLTADFVREVAEGVDGVRGGSGSVSNVLIPETTDGSAALELVEGADGDSSLAAAYAGDDFGRTVQFYAVSDSAFDSYFANGYLRLVDGEPVTEDSGDGVLVSREFAEKNGLAVGDEFSVRRATVHAQMAGIDVEDTRTRVRVAGVFEPTAKSQADLSSWSMDNAIFGTISTLDHAREGTAEQGYDRVTFQVDDPAELGRITGEVEGLDALAGKGYLVSADTSDVDAVSAPLENMDRLVTALAAASVAVGAVVLYLVLSGRVRDRLHESGVLLSLGLTRASVVGQYLCEVLLVAAVAFALAVPASGLAARTMGGALLGSASESVQTGGGEGGVSTADGVSTVSGDPFAPTFEVDGASFTDIEVEVGPTSVAALFGVGLAVSAAAVLLASLPLRRMGPREILSTLS